MLCNMGLHLTKVTWRKRVLIPHAVAGRDCDSWGCCNSSQQRFYKDWKASRLPRRRGKLWHMIFLLVWSNCETFLYCSVAVTSYGMNDRWGTGNFNVIIPYWPTQVITFSSLFTGPLQSARIPHAQNSFHSDGLPNWALPYHKINGHPSVKQRPSLMAVWLFLSHLHSCFWVSFRLNRGRK